MITTSQARKYSPDMVRARYVRKSITGSYVWCEVGEDRRYDLRQGTIEGDELPQEVRAAADALAGCWPSYAVWPL